jgi:hypothetical protein
VLHKVRKNVKYVILGTEHLVFVQKILCSKPYFIEIIRKLKVSLCLINWALCALKTYGSGGIAQPVLTSALDGVAISTELSRFLQKFKQT